MASSKPVERILVIRTGAIGDVILTLPAVSAIRQTYPAASICVVGNLQAWRLATNLVNETLSVDSALFSSLYLDKPSSELRDWLNGFDCVISWSSFDFKPVLQTAGVSLIISDSPYPPPGIHSSQWFLQTLARLPLLETKIRDFRLDLRSGKIVPVPGPLGAGGGERRVIVHPGAGAAWKCWPPERFASVIEALKKEGDSVFLVEGPADRSSLAEIKHYLEKPVPVIQEPDLVRLAPVISQADLFLGNDSGITHLAAVLGIPTVALFGPTDPVNWSPLGHSAVVRRCRAETRRQGQVRVCDDPDCLLSISAEEVLNALSCAKTLNGEPS